MEGFEIRKFREASRNLLRENMRWVRAFLMTSPLMDLLGAVVLCMILLYARDEIKVGRLTIGFLARSRLRCSKRTSPSSISAIFISCISRRSGRSTQVFLFLDLREEMMDAPDAKVLPRFAQADRI